MVDAKQIGEKVIVAVVAYPADAAGRARCAAAGGRREFGLLAARGHRGEGVAT